MPQYLITCPECHFETRVRFIRKGATATCVQCQHQYRIDAKSMALESEDEPQEASEGEDRPFELLRDRLRPPADPPEPAVESEAESTPSPAPQAAPAIEPAAAAAAVAAASATKQRDPAAAKARLAARSRAKRKGSPMLIIGGVATAIGLIAIIVGLILVGGNENTPPTAVNPPDKPDIPQPPDTPDPVTPAVVAEVPTVTLQVPSVAESSWRSIDPPATPISARQPDGSLWNVALVPGIGGQLKLLALYIADSDAVYRAGNLHIQLLDENRQAFAEFNGVVPVVCAAQGLQFTTNVPSEMKDRAASVVSRFDPVDPLPDAVPLETVDNAARLVKPEPIGWRVELVVRNPYLRAVSDPTIVVDLLDVSGTVAQTWRGSLRAKLAPGESLTFQTIIPVATSAEPERITLRSYARQSP